MSHGYLVQEGRSTTIQASRCLLSFPSSAQVLLHGTILPGRGRDGRAQRPKDQRQLPVPAKRRLVSTRRRGVCYDDYVVPTTLARVRI